MAESLTSFLDRLASGAPAPGGGAAAALAGATAAALVAMACRVTARGAPSEALVAAERAEDLRRRLMTLMQEDIDAYEAVLESRRAPLERRAPLMQAAMLRATRVPLNTARAAADVLELCASVLDAVRPSTVGDLGVAVLLSGAALDASTLTVRINLRDVADADFRTATRDTLERLTLAAGSRRGLARRVAARAGLSEPDAEHPWR